MEEREKIADYADRYLEMWKTDPDFFGEYSELIEIEGLVLRNSALPSSLIRTVLTAPPIFEAGDSSSHSSAILFLSAWIRIHSQLIKA